MIDNTFSIHALGKLWSTNINEDVYVRQCLLGSPLGKRMNTPGQPFIHNFKQDPRTLTHSTRGYPDDRTNCFASYLPPPRSNLTGSEDGGARRSRTDDILLAKQALYQLSYGPIFFRRTLNPGWPGQTRTVDLTLIRRTL